MPEPTFDIGFIEAIGSLTTGGGIFGLLWYVIIKQFPEKDTRHAAEREEQEKRHREERAEWGKRLDAIIAEQHEVNQKTIDAIRSIGDGK